MKEFTELQGVVGGLYARAQGEPEAVWQAIYDHYKPVSMEDPIPRSRAGRLVSLADKLDTLRGCFRVGLIPTGSRDPFALRRAAQGVVKILVEGRLSIPLPNLIGDDRATRRILRRPREVLFPRRARLRVRRSECRHGRRLERSGRIWKRVCCACRPPTTPDFEPLAASFKRIRNILDQAAVHRLDAFTPALLEPGPESDLFDEINRRIAGQPIETVIRALRPKVDLFFDKVLVNAPDPAVRRNRLTCCTTCLRSFRTIADFSEIVTNS